MRGWVSARNWGKVYTQNLGLPFCCSFLSRTIFSCPSSCEWPKVCFPGSLQKDCWFFCWSFISPPWHWLGPAVILETLKMTNLSSIPPSLLENIISFQNVTCFWWLTNTSDSCFHDLSRVDSCYPHSVLNGVI